MHRIIANDNGGRVLFPIILLSEFPFHRLLRYQGTYYVLI